MGDIRSRRNGLQENAHRFGFALSYPDDAEEITGFRAEPWHYRYIGPDHAEAWAESDVVLIEYLLEVQ